MSAQQRLDAMHQQMTEINAALRVDASDLDLPAYVPPVPLTVGTDQPPLVSSAWSFVDQCHALKASKRYGGEA